MYIEKEYESSFRRCLADLGSLTRQDVRRNDAPYGKIDGDKCTSPVVNTYRRVNKGEFSPGWQWTWKPLGYINRLSARLSRRIEDVFSDGRDLVIMRIP